MGARAVARPFRKLLQQFSTVCGDGLTGGSWGGVIRNVYMLDIQL